MSEKVREKSLTPRQLVALAALTAGNGSVATAAAAAAVAPKTVYQWLKQPLFAGELRRIQAEAIRHTARRLVVLGDLAAEALERGLAAGQPMAQQLRAAEIVLDRGPGLLELGDLVERMGEIERRLHEQEHV